MATVPGCRPVVSLGRDNVWTLLFCMELAAVYGTETEMGSEAIRSVTQPWKQSVREGAINVVLVNCLKQILFEKIMGEIDEFAHYADFL